MGSAQQNVSETVEQPSVMHASMCTIVHAASKRNINH
jgi:hypothetical protein